MTITTRPSETDPNLPRNAQIAAAVLARQGNYGAVSDIAGEFDVSRGRVYRAKGGTNGGMTRNLLHP